MIRETGTPGADSLTQPWCAGVSVGARAKRGECGGKGALVSGGRRAGKRSWAGTTAHTASQGVWSSVSHSTSAWSTARSGERGEATGKAGAMICTRQPRLELCSVLADGELWCIGVTLRREAPPVSPPPPHPPSSCMAEAWGGGALCCGVVLGTVGYALASLASAYEMPVAPSAVTAQNVLRHCQMSLRGQSHLVLRIPVLETQRISASQVTLRTAGRNLIPDMSLSCARSFARYITRCFVRCLSSHCPRLTDLLCNKVHLIQLYLFFLCLTVLGFF